MKNRRRRARNARRNRIKTLKKALQKASDGQMMMFGVDKLPARLQEMLLRRALECETQPRGETTAALLARKYSFKMPPAKKLTDAELSTKLEMLIALFSENGVYMLCTDHLSDRELYIYLRKDLTTSELEDFGKPNSFTTYNLSMPSEPEDNSVFLRHYADESDREYHCEDYPDETLPDMEPPPFDRDRTLPRPPCSGPFSEHPSRMMQA